MNSKRSERIVGKETLNRRPTPTRSRNSAWTVGDMTGDEAKAFTGHQGVVVRQVEPEAGGAEAT